MNVHTLEIFFAGGIALGIPLGMFLSMAMDNVARSRSEDLPWDERR